MVAKQGGRAKGRCFPLMWFLLAAGISMAHAGLPSLPEAVGAQTLEDQRAMYNISSVQLGHMTSNAQLSNTQMQGAFASGDNVLGAGAFDHAQGISTVIQNSGHNVIIQESLILNVNVAP